MEVEQLAIPKRKAEEEFQALSQAFKQNTKLRREEMRQDLKKVYGFLRHGKKIIDIYESFKKAGLNEDGDPKLAICRADGKQCNLVRHDDGSAVFGVTQFNKWQAQYDNYQGAKTRGDVWVPSSTFDFPLDHYKHVAKRYRQTIVPIIPAKILVNEVKVLLRNFHILWEVEEWKPIPPKDPILLKKLTPNLYGILATWNLTKLERAVIRGRIT